MKKQFTRYLESIGMPKAFRTRVREIHKFYGEICPDEIAGIFVTDYITEDGSREYENLWFFSPKCCMEATLFLVKDDFDMYAMRNRLDGWRMQKRDYDFKKATEKSRLVLIFRLDSGAKGTLKASKENCDYLRDVILKYVLPNLKE